MIVNEHLEYWFSSDSILTALQVENLAAVCTCMCQSDEPRNNISSMFID